MGFFSWKCNGCDNSIVSHFGIDERTYPECLVVAIDKDGEASEGIYDGYGRIYDTWFTDETLAIWEGPSFEQVQIFDYGEDGLAQACVWHARCWHQAGQPTEYVPSVRAQDQGYFFDPSDRVVARDPGGSVVCMLTPRDLLEYIETALARETESMGTDQQSARADVFQTYLADLAARLGESGNFDANRG